MAVPPRTPDEDPARITGITGAPRPLPGIRVGALAAEEQDMNRDGSRLGVAVVIVLGVLVVVGVALTVAPNALPALQVLAGR